MAIKIPKNYEANRVTPARAAAGEFLTEATAAAIRDNTNFLYATSGAVASGPVLGNVFLQNEQYYETSDASWTQTDAFNTRGLGTWTPSLVGMREVAGAYLWRFDAMACNLDLRLQVVNVADPAIIQATHIITGQSQTAPLSVEFDTPANQDLRLVLSGRSKDGTPAKLWAYALRERRLNNTEILS